MTAAVYVEVNGQRVQLLSIDDPTNPDWLGDWHGVCETCGWDSDQHTRGRADLPATTERAARHLAAGCGQ